MPVPKTLITVGAIAVIALAGVGGVGIAGAVSETGGGGNTVDRLVERFNINKSDVEEVFQQAHEERRAERKNERSDRLDNAVQDGDITEDQKTAIEAKLNELDAAREKEREELQAWADEQGIDARLVMGHGGKNKGDNRLNAAVECGDITEAQRTAIETKRDELGKSRESSREAFENWAEEQGIDLSVIGRWGEGGLLGGGRHCGNSE